jgi:predicted GIY-YIG superfamily endonuclease
MDLTHEGTHWSCYLLESPATERTYVGATVDIHRRLRQHNREITGGARATAGQVWVRACHVTGFVTQREALQFEWRWKFYGRKYETHIKAPLERRLRALKRLVDEWRETRPAVLLQIIWEESHAEDLWHLITSIY